MAFLGFDDSISSAGHCKCQIGKAMRFVYLFSLVCLFLAPMTQAQSTDGDDCVYAVDIEDEDLSEYNICGKSSGINKILNNIGDTEEKASTSSVEFKEKAQESTAQWIDNANLLAARRFELLLLIAKECPNGFEVKGEKYAVSSSLALDLQFDYLCN